MTPVSLLALLAGCNPHDATLNGEYVVFMDAVASETSARLDTETTERLSERAGDLDLWPVDCRALENEDERLPDAADCPADAEVRWFTWVDRYRYYRKSGKITVDGDTAPWRTEALITQEGGLQLTAHVDVDGIGDFRFGWVIDPDFAPATCEDVGEDGEGSEVVPTDGDWLANWSEGKDGTFWHLTAGAYQLNPSNTQDYWYFPQEWATGLTFARFSDENFYGQPISYSDVNGYPTYHPTYRSQYGTDTPPFPVAGTYGAWLNDVEAYLDGATELSAIGGSDIAIDFVMENNDWRLPEEERETDEAGGIENWAGISTSWVRIDNPEAIMVDNETPVTGEFQAYLVAAAPSASAILVRSTFSISHIRADQWGYEPSLESRKREENNTPICGEDRLTFGSNATE